jgi:hypothetical protein
LLELQWNILPRFYSIDVDVRQLFERSIHYRFGECNVRVLSREDQMLYLCIHAAKHQWSRLGMIRDIAELARAEMDWTSVAREARRLGITRILAISLTVANRLLRLELPEPLRGSLDEDTFQLASAIEANVRTGRELPADSLGYFRLMLQLRERWRDQRKFVWRLATTASVGEWETVRIPDALYPLYSGVRAFRLGRRLTTSALKS